MIFIMMMMTMVMAVITTKMIATTTLTTTTKTILYHFSPAAVCGALTGAVGNIVGGVLIKTFKLGERGSALMFVGAVSAVLAGLLVMISLGCPQASMAYTEDRPLTEFGQVYCKTHAG